MSVNHQLVQQLFAQAIAIADPQERQAFLVENCGHDGDLLRRVTDLLTAFDRPQPFFDHPTELPSPNGNDQVGPSLQKPGNIIAGRYKLLEAIAEGGMGTVWVAEQIHPIKRKVALKLIKPGMDSRQVLARFDAERQALALMDHPNIAKVYDGGMTEQGRPYFAMEYVKGMPLTEYCDQARLSVDERLKLFVPICQAIQHAHQKGIIHRDLKPSNVLICLYDGKPVPKVIDFGLAKAMHQPLTEQTLHTGHGLMLGTPLYMSPEQAENNNLDVDTRSDVYSLGVMLYELLTGTTPLEKAQLKQAAFGEILRLIKEVEPPKPSTRISTSAQRASIAAQRSLDPEQLGRSISGDLDWIIMKALDKERNRRYETANGLARDIERFLNQEAVEACPPSARYRLKKQFQKHRAAITTTAAFIVLITIAAITSTWQAFRATRAEAQARNALDRAVANEQQALKAQTAESNAREAEVEARFAEAKQRADAETQRVEAERQRDEAQRLQAEAVARSNQLEQLSEAQRKALYVSDMNQVRLEAMRGDLTRMRDILFAQLPIDHPDLRGFEWYYWYRYLTQAKKLHHFDDLRASPGPARPLVLPKAQIVVLPVNKASKLVDINSGEVLQELTGTANQSIPWAQFAANGRAVYAETVQAQSAATLGTNSSQQDEGATEREGFVVTDPYADAKHWTYPEGTFTRASSLAISEDGRFVAAIGKELTHTPEQPACRLLVWDIDSKEIILNHLESRLLDHVTLSPDGSRVAAYQQDGMPDTAIQMRDAIVVIDVQKDEVLGVVRDTDLIAQIHWHPNQQELLYTTRGLQGRQQRELLTWNFSTNQRQRISTEFLTSDAVTELSPNGLWLAISSPNSSTIRVLDSQTGTVSTTLNNEASNILSHGFNVSSNSLIAISAAGDVIQWKIASADDKFALRSRPLPAASWTELAQWAFSDDQRRLAYIQGTEFTSVRSIDGQELFHRELTDAGNARGRAAVAFDRSGDRLAIAYETGGTNPNDRSSVVELIDLRTGKLAWSHPLKPSFMTGFYLAFSNDSSVLAVAYGGNVVHLDSASGKERESRFGEVQGFFLAHQVRRALDNERTFLVGYLSKNAGTGPSLTAVVYDLFSGDRLGALDNRRINTVQDNTMVSSSLAISPRGDRVTRRQGSEYLELWDLPNKQLLTSLPGTSASFSNDGSLMVVINAQPLRPRGTLINPRFSQRFNQPQDRNPGPITSPKIYSTSNGQLISTLNFAGNSNLAFQFSADNKRLLTFHGQEALDGPNQPAQVRIWDCQTGQEILNLPIALESRCYWDLIISPHGDLLTALVFAGLPGSSTKVGSEVFDATSLPAAADAQLIADKWINELKSLTPVPQQITDAINKNPVATKLVQQTALAAAQQLRFDAEKISDRCLETVLRVDLPADKYALALSWAQELANVEPRSVRTLALTGAAQYRLGQYAAALQTIQRDDQSTSTDGSHPVNLDKSWEMQRRAVEVLCLHQLGNDPMLVHRKAIELADYMHDQSLLPTSPLEPLINLVKEALNTQGRAFASQQTQPRYQATQATSADSRSMSSPLSTSNTFFKMLDKNGDKIVSKTEAQPRTWDQIARFDRDGTEGLSVPEWTASYFVSMAQAEARSRKLSASNAAIFNKLDVDQDKHLSQEEAKLSWRIFEPWDKTRMRWSP